MRFRYRFLFIICCLSFFSCNSPYTTKKKGYYKITFPEHEYQLHKIDSYPYTFEYPIYARIVHDSNYLGSMADNDYWLNVDFPQFNAKFFLSYKLIGGMSMLKIKESEGKYKDSSVINTFDHLINDAFNLTNKNDVAATSINDSLFITPKKIKGIYFKVGGNAATSRQFFMTDSTRHFLRGALYFDATPNVDSLKPVLDFLEKDMKHLIQTLQWQ